MTRITNVKKRFRVELGAQEEYVGYANPREPIVTHWAFEEQYDTYAEALKRADLLARTVEHVRIVDTEVAE